MISGVIGGLAACLCRTIKLEVSLSPTARRDAQAGASGSRAGSSIV